MSTSPLSLVVLALVLEDGLRLGVLKLEPGLVLEFELRSGLSTRSSPFVCSRVGLGVGGGDGRRVSAA